MTFRDNRYPQCLSCGRVRAYQHSTDRCLCGGYVAAARVAVHGNVVIGQDVSICEPAEVNGTGSQIVIGDGCDIASFTVLNCADSHRKCVGPSDSVDRHGITLEPHVFVGTFAFIGPGWTIGHHSVVAAGTILAGQGGTVPPYSLVVGNPAQICELLGCACIFPDGLLSTVKDWRTAPSGKNGIVGSFLFPDRCYFGRQRYTTGFKRST